ncbi:MAG: hypothetical protein M3Z11_11420 [Candidatus Dormibacteraeota bacterium]|nr:hypothetical protein [Candidatus Dormibacteraeota bacterium]
MQTAGIVPAVLLFRLRLLPDGAVERSDKVASGSQIDKVRPHVLTVFTIVAFGSLTLGLHREFLRGDRAALALAGFIGLYWVARIVVDTFYFDHADWPRGRAFVFVHVMLTGLFLALASTYIGLLMWRLVNPS